jgi:predicted phosphodiesterase
MSEDFRLVHLSDLHFSHGSIRKSDHSHCIERLSGIDRILSQISFDRLIVSGDISDRGDPESLNQAREWLLDSFGTGDKRRTGLRLRPDQLILVPGNHDAYNCEHASGSPLEHRQRSLANFNDIFSDHAFSHGLDCRYHWITKGQEAIFVGAVDSSFLGDKTLEHIPGLREQVVSRFSAIARGRWSCDQTERVLQWFDMGIRGRLPVDHDSEDLIDGLVFRKSLKILLMHHYIFEPPAHTDSISLRLCDKKAVFRNLAMADFDMLLCGHKHVADFQPVQYGSYFIDQRSRGRYLVNLFRRMIGIHTMPAHVSGKNGQLLAQRLVDLMNILVTRRPQKEAESVAAYVERLLSALRSLLDDPDRWRLHLKEFLGQSDVDHRFRMPDTEVRDIARHVSAQLSKADRKALSGMASDIKHVLAQLDRRPFVQSMSGSSGKSVRGQDKRRSFSIYDITLDGGAARVRQQEYAWEAGAAGFGEPFERVHEFKAGRRAAF